jgi:hypothetical protein
LEETPVPNITISAPDTIILVTILEALGFALIACLSGETKPDPTNGLPWGGPASELVNYTLYGGFFVFLTAIGLHWVLAGLCVLLWVVYKSYSTKMLHPVIDEMIARYKAKRQTHININVTPTSHDQDPPEWV